MITNTKFIISYKVFNYGVLKDKTIVKIHSWSLVKNNSNEALNNQELYFDYVGLFKSIKRKKGAWAKRSDFVYFAKSKKEAKEFIRYNRWEK